MSNEEEEKLAATPRYEGMTQEEQQQVTAPYEAANNALQEQLDNYKETKTDEQKRKKRDAARRLIYSISDALTGIANMAHTNKGMPNMYDHDKNSLLKGYNERAEKAKAERERNRAMYDKLAQQIAANKAAGAEALAKAKTEHYTRWKELQKMPYEFRALDNQEAVADQNLRLGKIKTDAAQFDLDHMPEKQRREQEQHEAAISHTKAQTNAANASAANSRATAAATNDANNNRVTVQTDDIENGRKVTEHMTSEEWKKRKEKERDSNAI